MFRRRIEDSAKDCSDEVVHPPHNQVNTWLPCFVLPQFPMSARWFVRWRTPVLEEGSLVVSGLAATVVGKFGNFSTRGNVDVVRNLMIMVTTTTNNS